MAKKKSNQQVGKEIIMSNKRSRNVLKQILNADKRKVSNGRFKVEIDEKVYLARQLG